MILIGLGANLAGPWGNAVQTLNTAIETLRQDRLRVENYSSFYVSTPYGGVSQPDYVNAVVRLSGPLPPDALMKKLHVIERSAGRRRGRRWGARVLDLDLLDWHGIVRNPSGQATGQAPGRAGGRSPGHIALTLPHPGLALRPFVLAPIAEIAPGWRHPLLNLSAAELLARLKPARGGRILRRL